MRPVRSTWLLSLREAPASVTAVVAPSQVVPRRAKPGGSPRSRDTTHEALADARRKLPLLERQMYLVSRAHGGVRG
jgi:hypothetical protein